MLICDTFNLNFDLIFDCYKDHAWKSGIPKIITLSFCLSVCLSVHKFSDDSLFRIDQWVKGPR